MRVLIVFLATLFALGLPTSSALAHPTSPHIRKAQQGRHPRRRMGRRQRIERARVLFREGAAAYEAGRLHQALEKLLAAQRTWRSPELAFNIARCYERMGESEKGVRWFRIYLRHGRPEEQTRADVERRISALSELGQRQRGQIYAAPPSRDELTEEARTFFRRGVTMFQGGHFEAAMQAFTAAYNFAPFAELVYNMAITAERLERFRDASDYLREYLRMRRNAPDRADVERMIRELRARRAENR
jgi:tetratricopeptide (TPR) repeat protein